jgi:hypothetical protein
MDLEASAASAIVVSQGLAAARPPITAGQEPLDTRPTPPSPGRRPTRRASGSTGSDRGAWGDPLVTSAAGRPAGNQPQHGRGGCGPSTTANLADRGLQGSPPTRSWRPESATWSGCPWSRRRMRSCCVGREVADPDAGAHPPPRPHAGAARRAASARSSDSPGPVEALPMTGWAGARPACPHLGKLGQ